MKIWLYLAIVMLVCSIASLFVWINHDVSKSSFTFESHAYMTKLDTETTEQFQDRFTKYAVKMTDSFPIVRIEFYFDQSGKQWVIIICSKRVGK